MDEKIIQKLNDKDFNKKVIDTKKIVLVDFWAEWCGPCKILSPILEKIAEEYFKKVIFYKINIDENPISGPKYDVNSIPTLILFKNGKVMDKKSGVLSQIQIKNFLNNYVK